MSNPLAEYTHVILRDMARCGVAVLAELEKRENIQTKGDGSVSITPDMVAHRAVKNIGEKIELDVLSEEDAQLSLTKPEIAALFKERIARQREKYFIITDPFDGSKEGGYWMQAQSDDERANYNGFSVNLGIVRKDGEQLSPVQGFSCQPARRTLFWSEKNNAYQMQYDASGALLPETKKEIHAAKEYNGRVSVSVSAPSASPTAPKFEAPAHSAGITLSQDIGLSRLMHIASDSADITDITSKDHFELLAGPLAILEAAGGHAVEKDKSDLKLTIHNLHDKVGYAGSKAAMEQFCQRTHFKTHTHSRSMAI